MKNMITNLNHNLEVGDKVIYMGGCKDPYIDSILEVGRVYTISKIYGKHENSDLYLYFDWERKNTDNGFPVIHFKQLIEFRKDVLLKIKERIHESK